MAVSSSVGSNIFDILAANLNEAVLRVVQQPWPLHCLSVCRIVSKDGDPSMLLVPQALMNGGTDL